MDIKYVYIHGAKRNAYLLAIIDVATPEENSYIESLLSLVEKEVIRRYQFDSLYHAREVFQRYFTWHNTQIRGHAQGRVSPEEYWNTVFHCHPVKPPAAQSGECVKSDDTAENFKNKASSLVLPLTNSERGLSLLDRMTRERPNCFEKYVQKIGDQTNLEYNIRTSKGLIVLLCYKPLKICKIFVLLNSPSTIIYQLPLERLKIFKRTFYRVC
ncbi:MAG TPA: hypothetical protein ENN49_09015 [Bacteroidales bacterium]|nr:hypothetical protein [Bacteroidales bacterium]